MFKDHDIVNNKKILTCPYDFSIILAELISNSNEKLHKDSDKDKYFYTNLSSRVDSYNAENIK